MSCTGGMGTMATTFYKRLAAMISKRKGIPYSQTMHLIRAKISFALLRSSMHRVLEVLDQQGTTTSHKLSEGHFIS